MGDHNHRILDVKNVVKTFGGLRANDGVSLQVEKGEIRALIGPNGSGKTTLINMITGNYQVTEGSIFSDGKRIDGLKPNVIASLGILRTFQVARVWRDMTILENMLIPAFTQGQSRHEAQTRADELLEFALLTRLRNNQAKSLSGGQNMLLQIVRGFMHKDLKLYVMDEPFAGIHQSIKGIIIDSIKMMNRERGVTFLVVTHEMSTVKALCSKVSVLCRGKRIAEGTMEEIADNPEVIDAYLGG